MIGLTIDYSDIRDQINGMGDISRKLKRRHYKVSNGMKLVLHMVDFFVAVALVVGFYIILNFFDLNISRWALELPWFFLVYVFYALPVALFFVVFSGRTLSMLLFGYYPVKNGKRVGLLTNFQRALYFPATIYFLWCIAFYRWLFCRDDVYGLHSHFDPFCKINLWKSDPALLEAGATNI